MGFKESLVHGAKKLGRAIYAKSPTLLVVGGTVGLVVAGVVACKETKEKFDQIIEEHKAAVQAAKDIRDGVVEIPSCTTEEYAKDYKKHLTYIYLQTICKFFKAYAPALLMAIASITMIFSGHHILAGWHKFAVAQGYAYLTGWEEYRKRVAGVVGDEREREIYTDSATVVATDKIKNPETGEEEDKSFETLAGSEHRGPYTYICSEETMCSYSMYNSDADFRKGLYLKIRTGIEYLSRHDQITLYDLMRHFWNDDYLRKHSETFTDGWWVDNPLCGPLDPVTPIEYEVKLISEPGEPRKYEVTFHPQGNIVHAMAAKREQERREKRFDKKVKTFVRPAQATA